MSSAAEEIRRKAIELGFVAVGIAPAQEAPHWEALRRWVEAGRFGEMEYIPRRLEAYRHPEGVLPGCRSLVVVAWPYRPYPFEPLPVGAGRVAAYAVLPDYHTAMASRLRQLGKEIQRIFPDSRWKVAVDTAPLLERSFAAQAGLGWIGRNCMLIHPRWGSYVFLGAVLTTAELPPDPPQTKTYCGSCRACLRACPTGAIVAPYELDARRCISYWTIEARSLPPRELRELFGDWFFGCDLCQQVCPWNRKILAAATNGEPGQRLLPGPIPHVDPCDILLAADDELRARFRDLPLWRAKSAGLRRNAALVLGNALRRLRHAELANPDFAPATRAVCSGTEIFVKETGGSEWGTAYLEGTSASQRTLRPVDQWLRALAHALESPHPMVRQAAAWALGCHLSPGVRQLLAAHLEKETDPAVREEITQILATEKNFPPA